MGELLNRLNSYLEEEQEEQSEYEEIVESLLSFISTLDLDELCESQVELLDEAIDKMNETEYLHERAGKVKRVVRDKKKVRRKVCGSGYKLVDGKCKKMSASEKRKRSKGAKRGSKKKRGQKAQIKRKQQRSLAKR